MVDRKKAHEKADALMAYLKEQGSVAIAFSGGVDSTLLLYLAKQALGDKTAALTATSPSFPAREAKEAADFCKEHGIRQIAFESHEIDLPGYRQNPVDRCYICKKGLFGKMLSLASENGFSCVAEGSNMDDNGDYRPGLMAIKELGILSPLRHAGLYKEEIRALSEEYGLPTWNKQSFACLASRFVYGEEISEEKLLMVERAESLLLTLGLSQLRVRIHDRIARIEVFPEDFGKILENREKINTALRSYGFSYVTLDLMGYRTGSMNETLDKATLEKGLHKEDIQ